MAVLSEIETKKGKADKGNNVSHNGYIIVIYSLLSMTLRTCTRLYISSNLSFE